METSVESSVPIEPAPAKSEVSKPVKRRKRKGSSLKLSNTLDHMEGELDRRLEEIRAQQGDMDEPQSYEINTSVTIDEEAFNRALAKYAERLKAENRMNLSSTLLNGKSTFEHNKWHFLVESELQMGMVDKEKELLPFLRKELDVRDLFGELAYDASLAQQIQSVPYTDEEKMKAMVKKNPSLLEFQKIFKTRIIY